MALHEALQAFGAGAVALGDHETVAEVRDGLQLLEAWICTTSEALFHYLIEGWEVRPELVDDPQDAVLLVGPDLGDGHTRSQRSCSTRHRQRNLSGCQPSR